MIVSPLLCSAGIPRTARRKNNSHGDAVKFGSPDSPIGSNIRGWQGLLERSAAGHQFGIVCYFQPLHSIHKKQENNRRNRELIQLTNSLKSIYSLRNIVFLVFLLRCTRKSYYTLRGHGIVGTAYNIYAAIRLFCYRWFLRAPGVRGQVDKQVSGGLTKLQAKLAPQLPGITRNLELPKEGWATDQVRAELEKLAGLDHTRWEDGRVSGAVYHGGEDLLKLQTEAFGQFGVANPIHPDVFPGVRKMEAEVVAMVGSAVIFFQLSRIFTGTDIWQVLGLFNAPEDGAGVTTSGGTESILMACLSARQKAHAERGVTEPEM